MNTRAVSGQPPHSDLRPLIHLQTLTDAGPVRAAVMRHLHHLLLRSDDYSRKVPLAAWHRELLSRIQRMTGAPHPAARQRQQGGGGGGGGGGDGGHIGVVLV